jgi:hypothetical protein
MLFQDAKTKEWPRCGMSEVCRNERGGIVNDSEGPKIKRGGGPVHSARKRQKEKEEEKKKVVS